MRRRSAMTVGLFSFDLVAYFSRTIWPRWHFHSNQTESHRELWGPRVLHLSSISPAAHADKPCLSFDPNNIVALLSQVVKPMVPKVGSGDPLGARYISVSQTLSRTPPNWHVSAHRHPFEDMCQGDQMSLISMTFQVSHKLGQCPTLWLSGSYNNSM